MASAKRRFKIRPADVAAVPACKPVPSVNAPAFSGERRRVLTATPDGLISWHDFESARLNQTIAAKVASEKRFISHYTKPQSRK